MHRNSLRYRLARTERMLGRSLKPPATIAAVYVALAAEAASHDAPGPRVGARGAEGPRRRWARAQPGAPEFGRPTVPAGPPRT